MNTIIVGAGLAGLACAIASLDAGHHVTLLDSGPAAGGRCRSYEDRELGCRIDNGNHLLLSGNEAAHAYLRRIGAQDSLAGPATALFPFHDLATHQSWTLRPSPGRLPCWIADRSRRVPDTGLLDHAALIRWLHVRPGTTVADIAPAGALTHRLIEPLAIAALNTLPGVADATLMQAVMRQSLLRGGAACIPSTPAIGLSESFVDPAMALLRAGGAFIQFGRRVTALRTDAGRITALATTDGELPITAHDRVILAVPAPIAGTLLPGLIVPDAFEAILNVHYRIDLDPGPTGFIGVVSGLAEWFFFKPGVTSVTISAANRYADRDPDEIAAAVWAELAHLRPLPAAMPKYRVVRERRATFAATPAQARRRPAPDAAGLANLTLAGDWTATGLPATIEGAIRSGQRAAALA